MQAEHKANKTAGVGAPSAVASAEKREQSSIEFPYTDLDSAVEVVKAINQIGGHSCDMDQLGAFWKVVPTGGGFRARYAPARTFGLLTADKGRLVLTPLGMKITDRTQEQSARVEAFLHVGLYKAIYEKYKSYPLPGVPALEAEIVKLGVASKQKDKARQVLMRSARQAGFFWAGEDRLSKPNVAATAAPEPPQSEPDRALPEREQTNGRTGGFGASGGGQYHPFILGLLATLPEPGTVWTIDGRAAWLQAAAQNFTLMYKGDGRIEVQVHAPLKADKAA